MTAVHRIVAPNPGPYTGPGTNTWIDQDLTNLAAGSLAALASDVSSYAFTDGQHVFYAASDQHIHQLYYAPHTNSWIDQDLTNFASGSLAMSGSCLSGYANTNGQHVNYLTL